MSRDFNGSTGLIGLLNVSVLHPTTLPATISAWIRPDTIQTSGILTNNKITAANRGLWMFLSGTGGNIECGFGDDTGSNASDRRSKVGAAGVTAGSWQHVSCQITAATDMTIYRNAVDVGGTYSGTGGAVAYEPAQGAIGSVSAGFFFDGRIAEAALWGGALTADQHKALANGVSALRIRPDILLGYWPLYGVTSPEIDLSANGNNGNLTGTAPPADHAPVGPPYPVAS